MRMRIGVLLAALCAAFAQEDPRARARDLELQAEKALDEGRHADALKLLAEAAELRAKARDGAPPAAPEPKAAPAEPKAPGMPGAPAPTPAGTADAALAEMDGALGKGDAAAALKAGHRAHEALEAWARDLGERERRLAGGRPVDLEKRMAEAEAQLAELMKRVPAR
jgi:hypothetical protein